MVAKNDIITAMHEIEEALKKFVRDRACDEVHVFEDPVRVGESEWGHIRALIGSDAFKDMNVIERQEMVWDYLRKHVGPEHLVFLYGVHPMDHDEYRARTWEVQDG